jgi:hypothetical protein
MKKMQSVTTLFLGMGIAAFLFAGCEQATGPSGSGDKSSGESAKIKKDPSQDTLSGKPHSNPMRPVPLDPSHIRPLNPDSGSTIIVIGGDTTGPGCGTVTTHPINPDSGNGPHSHPMIPVDPGTVTVPSTDTSSSDLPPDCQRVGYADGKDHQPGDGYKGPYSGTVVCHMPNMAP